MIYQILRYLISSVHVKGSCIIFLATQKFSSHLLKHMIFQTALTTSPAVLALLFLFVDQTLECQ
jgi:hypothetical protein